MTVVTMGMINDPFVLPSELGRWTYTHLEEGTIIAWALPQRHPTAQGPRKSFQHRPFVPRRNRGELRNQRPFGSSRPHTHGLTWLANFVPLREFRNAADRTTSFAQLVVSGAEGGPGEVCPSYPRSRPGCRRRDGFDDTIDAPF